MHDDQGCFDWWDAIQWSQRLRRLPPFTKAVYFPPGFYTAPAETLREPAEEFQAALRRAQRNLPAGPLRLVAEAKNDAFRIISAPLTKSQYDTEREVATVIDGALDQMALSAEGIKQSLEKGRYSAHGSKEQCEANVAEWLADSDRGKSSAQIAETTPIRKKDGSRFKANTIEKQIRERRNLDSQNGRRPASE